MPKRKESKGTESDPPDRKITDLRNVAGGKKRAGTQRDPSNRKTTDLWNTARRKIPPPTQSDPSDYRVIALTEIRKHPTFESLLPIDRDLLESIIVDMRRNGFYPSQPVVLGTWPGMEGPVLIDGHARAQAAREAEIGHVPYVVKEFDDEMGALQHAMSLQSKRRSTKDGALYRLAGQYDRLTERGGDRRSEEALSMLTRVSVDGGRSASARRTATLLGCNYKKVDKIRKIRKDGTPEIQEAVKNDKMSINRAYQLIRRMEKGLRMDDEGPAKVADAQVRALQVVLTEKNFAGLNALGSDLPALVNSAIEEFISVHGNRARSEEPGTEVRES
ncbi:MAG: hypothetical protein AB1646_21380 [Thermodesulfobacteriota bacterium]